MTHKLYFSTSSKNYSKISNLFDNVSFVEWAVTFEDYISDGVDSYKHALSKRLINGVVYSYITKVQKGQDIYFSLHKTQHSFTLDNYDDERWDQFELILQNRLNEIFNDYNDELDGNLDLIIFEFTPISHINEHFDKIEDKNISNVKDLKVAVSDRKAREVQKLFYVFDKDILNIKGISLTTKFINDQISFVTDIPLLGQFIFDNVIHKDSDYTYVTHKGKNYVIATYTFEGTIFKQCLNIYGDSLHQVEDSYNDKGNFTRKKGNFITTYDSQDRVIDLTKNITFNTISPNYKTKTDHNTAFDNIGVIDLETYKDDNGKSHCYAVGYYTNSSKQLFYIDKDLDSHKLIHLFINSLLIDKALNNYRYYCHNLGGYDAPFILKGLINFNETTKGFKYEFDIHSRDRLIIRLTIKRCIEVTKQVKSKNGNILNKTIYVTRKISIYDSLAILPMSLRQLGSVYNIDNQKTFFPYDFVKPNTLWYVGDIPNVSKYGNIKATDLQSFNDFYDNIKNKSTWDVRQETLNYLYKDLVSLYEVLKIVNLNMFKLFDVQMTDSSTISGIAMNIFFAKYFKDKSLPLISSSLIYNDIFKAYYGGRVEVYHPKPLNGEKLYYYDVNSLYPFASLNDMPGLNWTFREFIVQPELSKLFGFYFCKVTTPKDLYLGLLPHRKDKGGLIYPLGEWDGWYFSEELKFAESHGYKIEVIKGYDTDKAKDVFTTFVKDIYKIKLNPKNIAEKNIAKLILNSLIGRFGMNPNKYITKILNEDQHKIVCSSRICSNSVRLDNNNYLDTFLPDINKDICTQFGLDYSKVYSDPKYKFKNSRSLKNNTISISTAAATLSYSRIFMLSVMLDILKRGGKLYYTDTDSIITNIKLPDHLVNNKELGKFKLEHEVVDCYFLADKFYLINNSLGKTIIKAKSVNESSLSPTDFEQLYTSFKLTGSTKTISKKNYKEGYTDISHKVLNLNIEKSDKRIRLFKNDKWIGTKPVIINNSKQLNNSLSKLNLPITRKYHTNRIINQSDFESYKSRLLGDDNIYYEDGILNGYNNKTELNCNNLEVDSFTITPLDCLFVLSTSNLIEYNNNTICIKLFMIQNIYDGKYSNFFKTLKILGVRQFHFIIINNNKTQIYYNNPFAVDKFTVINILKKNTIDFLNSGLYSFNNYNNYTLYLIKNSNFSEIKTLFRLVESKYLIDIGKGSQKSHLCSDIDLRLNLYLLALYNFDYNAIRTSNNFNNLDKYVYNGQFDMSNDIIKAIKNQ